MNAYLDALVAELTTAHADFTQREVANALGLAVNSVQDWELHRDSPTLLHLIEWP